MIELIIGIGIAAAVLWALLALLVRDTRAYVQNEMDGLLVPDDERFPHMKRMRHGKEVKKRRWFKWS